MVTAVIVDTAVQASSQNVKLQAKRKNAEKKAARKAKLEDAKAMREAQRWIFGKRF